MSLVVTSVRRLLWLVLLGAAGGAAYSWWRDRNGDGDLAPAEWPPLEPDAGRATVPHATTDLARDPGAPDPGEPAASSNSIVPDAAPAQTISTSASSVVNALVDAPEARSSDGDDGGWVEPLDDGSCPISHPIKANDNSGIFHVPGGRFYDRTNPERCYASTEAAVVDGYRQSKN